MKDSEQRAAAKAFAERWKDRGYEKGESQPFWIDLLEHVLGVENGSAFITFEDQVHLDHTSFIDGYIPQTKVLIEQKGLGKDMRKPIPQSDGTLLTPFQQAKRYITELPLSQHPRWVVTCNFGAFYVYDMEKPGGEPEEILLSNLEKEYYRLRFLVDSGNENLKREMEISIAAGDLVGILYDALLKQYKDPTNVESLKSLNMLCVRLVFCLYAEDAGIFGKRTMFHDYMTKYPAEEWREKLIQFFRVLDTEPERRDPYLRDDLAAFPYVNGGLFSDENIEIPNFTDEIRTIILSKASEDFDWSDISPTIFGAVFESTLNPETRRSGGMHYTSIENIHKVIDPLFLDELKKEFEEIKDISVEKTRKAKLSAYQEKLASLKFLDPACGSGNFLTETYLSIRHLENAVINEMTGGQISLGDVINPIKCSIQQFYGIEINDFTVTVAKTALWIAESQMMKETESIVHMSLDFLPLKTNAYIVDGNALRMDWRYIHENISVPRIMAEKTYLVKPEDIEGQSYVVAEPGVKYGEVELVTNELYMGKQKPDRVANHYDYIMGNPPFVGYSMQSKEQKEDILSVFVDEEGKTYKTAGKIDYVAGWYFKASQLMYGTNTRAALVSTNSITQGEQVAAIWKPLYERFGIHIDFAHRTFRWDSEASNMAHVHCVIVGFSCAENKEKCKLYSSERFVKVDNINPYLIEAPNIFVESRNKPISDVPEVIKGSSPVDGGNLLLSDEEYKELIRKEPEAKKVIKRFYGAKEYLHNIDRWCIWLEGFSPALINSLPEITKRVQATRDFRLQSTKEATQRYADYPTRFMEIRQPDTNYILIPRHSSENRRYIPFGFIDAEIICGDANIMMPKANLYHFGILNSNVHMAWVRTVCGRIKSDYRYSNDVVYNNFPWPEPSDEQKQKIEETAQMILDAREKYPDSSLADLYDDLTMPPELRKAHNENDKAVLAAYGFKKGTPEFSSESACVAALMRMYQEKVSQK